MFALIGMHIKRRRYTIEHGKQRCFEEERGESRKHLSQETHLKRADWNRLKYIQVTELSEQIVFMIISQLGDHIYFET